MTDKSKHADQVIYTRETYECLSTSYSVAVGIAFLPEEYRPRMEKLVDDLRKKESKNKPKGYRDTLILEYYREYYAGVASKSRASQSIAYEMKLAASLANPASGKLMACKNIILHSEGKVLGHKRIYQILQ